MMCPQGHKTLVLDSRDLKKSIFDYQYPNPTLVDLANTGKVIHLTCFDRNSGSTIRTSEDEPIIFF